MERRNYFRTFDETEHFMAIEVKDFIKSRNLTISSNMCIYIYLQ